MILALKSLSSSLLVVVGLWPEFIFDFRGGSGGNVDSDLTLCILLGMRWGRLSELLAPVTIDSLVEYFIV